MSRGCATGNDERGRRSRLGFLHGRTPVRGFSLLETLAAILLLAIAVAALMRVASASLNLTDKVGQTARADMLAQGKLDALGIAEPLVPGEREGAFDRDYRWRLRVAPWNGEDLPVDGVLALYRVELRVLWGDARRPRELKYVTLRTARKGGA
ncbi:prepilin-type N-terminal cleavage/methylation domain-containing protein [Dyella sp. BiH032]|uniref:prepilin-type N-terminal cleavage/methylation domain-containing protein n=1 Tax=Dyella sp. BiH032 TaxID=3075430 RepID=UPI002892A6F1|nr:prepilin-type N-terminal cleavage/methylation domain-containing protein [Dyella sp. BiH032]WNL44452.1 prepilin-type N-terminal cleavage/methylation domain-containing protein [Dyella sp. BiH032]